jgi:phosphate-selective porin
VIVSLPLQTRIFTTPDLGGDEGDWAHLEVGWVHGPFMFGYEQMWGGPNGVAIVGGGEDDFDEMTGFSYSAACNLTGEPRGWKDGAWVPSVGPRPKDGPLSFLPEGRWELGLRYSNGDIDRKLFDNGYTTYAVSSQETRTFSTALFWEPCETFRVGLEWVKTIADDASAILGDEKRDSSFVLRLEVRF